MNIRLNEEVASKLNGVADGGRIGGTGESTNGSEANGLVHRTLSRIRTSGTEINGFTLFKNRALSRKTRKGALSLFGHDDIERCIHKEEALLWKYTG